MALSQCLVLSTALPWQHSSAHLDASMPCCGVQPALPCSCVMGADTRSCECGSRPGVQDGADPM